ncbi:hypothetical protein CPB86DRAFT_825101 [Serendipita vermifera]|nr:hypothetical protein CPB86DRAFT_825101 [Serendipita vermifera]
MASTTADRVRSSTGGKAQALHLGSFSRMEIADFDSRGRYPTTPSPQDTRAIPPVAPSWYPGDSTPLNHPNGLQPQQDQFNRDGNANNNAGSNGLPSEGQRKNSKDSETSLQDPIRASLPPGPRHPQAPSRASTQLQAAQQQNNHQIQNSPSRGAGNPSAAYPYTPAATATPPSANNQARLPDTSGPQNQQYMSGAINYGNTTIQMQDSPRPQVAPQPEEVCIECMMRDRDMADVVVVGPGIWDRESDVHLHELWAREDEEEKAWRERHAEELAIPGNKLRPPRRASKGHRLTEQNLKIWLTLNPKEAHARLMTIDAYIKQQAELLAQEAEARAKQEALQVEARSQGRQSVYDGGSVDLQSEGSGSGVRMQGGPRSSVYSMPVPGPREDYYHRRDSTFLDSGSIREQPLSKKEEKERRREEKKARKTSQITDMSTSSPGVNYASPMTPVMNGAEFGSNSDFEPPYPAYSSTSLQVSRPKSAPLGVPLNKYASYASMDGKSQRFMGAKHWQAPWGSGASVAPSGSMMDMHVALDREHDQQLYQPHGMPEQISRHQAMSSFSLPASPRNNSRPHTADATLHMRRSTSPEAKSKKSSGLGKLWKKVRSKKSEPKYHSSSFPSLAQVDDMNTPLPPPPKMSYLANQRPPLPPHTRQVSTPGSQNTYLPSPAHPRTSSQPSAAISPTTAPSSLLPSPTSNRFPWRESTGDDRRQSTAKELYPDHDISQNQQPSDPNAPAQYPEMNGTRGQGSASSEYGRLVPPSSGNPLTRSPAPSTMVSSSAHSPRPLSSMHKPLPPPPPSDISVRQSSATLQGNGYDTARQSTVVNPEDAFLPPAPFREEGYDGRRQSFGGMTYRADALPPGAAQRPPPSMIPYGGNLAYQEFGGYDGYMSAPYPDGALSDSNTTKNKRKSRFGLPFLGKKDKDKSNTVNGTDSLRASAYIPTSPPLSPPARPPFGHSQRSKSSASLTTPDFAPGLNATPFHSQPYGFNDSGRPMSGVSTFSAGQRINKPLINEAITRDHEYMPYQYPSAEQMMDVSRR